MQTLNLFVQTLVNSFQIKTREDGESFYCAKDNAPDYVSNLCYVAHDGMLPDDYKYAYLVEALEYINENLNLFDNTLDDIDVYDACVPDCMNHDLLRWVSSNLTRMECCDEVLQDNQPEQLSRVLMRAQEAERVDVMHAVVKWIESQQGNLWDMATLTHRY